MERRWGRRVAIGEVVQIKSGRQTLRGWLRDVSLSGAFLETSERLPYMGRVSLRLRHTKPWISADVEAYATRVSDEGVGLEWCDFAPAPIAALMDWQRHASIPKAS